jgi:hypothetical protein
MWEYPARPARCTGSGEGRKDGRIMSVDLPIDQLVATIHRLDRPGCIRELRAIARPRLDFTDDFLEAMSVEQLRHVLLAACLQARKHTRRAG